MNAAPPGTPANAKTVPLATVAIVVTASVLGGFAMGAFNPFGRPTMSAAISNCYVESNRSLPKMVDEYTRCDSVSPDTTDGKTIVYKYTLLVLDFDKIDVNQLKSAMNASAVKQYKESKSMEVFRRLSFVAKYQYFNVKGDKMLEFVVDPKTF
jgi:hypothetical protein